MPVDSKEELDMQTGIAYNNDNAAIITRESDGLRFERCLHPGMVRCEACLQLIEPSQALTHKCVEWWNETIEEYFRRWKN